MYILPYVLLTRLRYLTPRCDSRYMQHSVLCDATQQVARPNLLPYLSMFVCYITVSHMDLSFWTPSKAWLVLISHTHAALSQSASIEYDETSAARIQFASSGGHVASAAMSSCASLECVELLILGKLASNTVTCKHRQGALTGPGMTGFRQGIQRWHPSRTVLASMAMTTTL